jgi:hypothetical protein
MTVILRICRFSIYNLALSFTVMSEEIMPKFDDDLFVSDWKIDVNSSGVWGCGTGTGTILHMRLGLRRKFASAHFAKKVIFQKIHESCQIYVLARKFWLFIEILERRRTNIQQSIFRVNLRENYFNPTLIPLKMFQHWQIWKLQAYGGTHMQIREICQEGGPHPSPSPPTSS